MSGEISSAEAIVLFTGTDGPKKIEDLDGLDLLGLKLVGAHAIAGTDPLQTEAIFKYHAGLSDDEVVSAFNHLEGRISWLSDRVVPLQLSYVELVGAQSAS